MTSNTQLSALRECPLHDDAQHPGWSRYVAANLAAALSVIPDTGDWYWAVRSWCERTRGDVQPNPNPIVTRAEKAETSLREVEAERDYLLGRVERVEAQRNYYRDTGNSP